MPSATIRAARSSCCPTSSTPSSARACPAESTPAATRRCTGTGSFNRRMVLVTTGTAAAEPVGELGVGDAELFEELFVGGGLVERVELDAVDVLEQRVAEHHVVGGVPDDRGEGGESDAARGPEAALAHDELERSGARLADDDRLQEPELADRVLELRQRLFVEAGARLLRVGDDGGERDLAVLGRGQIRWARRTSPARTPGRRGGRSRRDRSGSVEKPPGPGPVGMSAASPRPRPPLRGGAGRSVTSYLPVPHPGRRSRAPRRCSSSRHVIRGRRQALFGCIRGLPRP